MNIQRYTSFFSENPLYAGAKNSTTHTLTCGIDTWVASCQVSWP